ncbi:MAG: hypothetical protein DMF24_11660 [Verrucomicrobia bacterium]|nr:MAG: hypothetical protein DMF24_11660 [Verrucomicrobiota bacterium]
MSVSNGVMLRAMMASLQAAAGESARTRIARRLLPFLFLLYVANYLDRTNIAYATLGMKGDLGLTDSVFGTASGIFFIGYFALQIPGALLVERWSARLLLAFTLITWGGLTTLTAFVHTAHQLYGARFLLGAAEAGFFPGVIVYLSHHVGDSDRLYSRRTARWRDPRDQLVGNTWLALVVFARRCAGGFAWNRHTIRTARSPNGGAVACA